MKQRTKYIASCLAALTMIVTVNGDGSFAAFQSKHVVTMGAVVTFSGSGGGGGGAPSGNLTLNVPLLLPSLAFFGNDVVIPVKMVGPTSSNSQGAIIGINATSSIGSAQLGGQSVPGVQSPASPGTGSDAIMAISMSYQMGSAGLSVTVPIAFQPVPGLSDTLAGKIVIPVQNLQSLSQGGTLNYFFQIARGNQLTRYLSNGAPFQIQFTNTLSFNSPANVVPNGWVVSVPDTNLTDGNTTISFAPNALSGPGTIMIRQDNVNTVPAGPGGLAPIVAYDFTLQGMELVREAHLTFNYPAHADGSLVGSNGNPADLAPYWLQDNAGWLVMGPRQWDSTLHTVDWTTPHLSKFALFLSGATSATALRPKTRILTPNGDNHNDRILFSGITASDGVHIYDLRGRRVRHLVTPNLDWDGRDDSGSIVESGIYIYQYTSNGERVSGVILVAK